MKQELIPEFRDFVALLNQHEIRYVVVGGYAVGWHGYPRATKDLDFFVERSPENAGKLLRVLAEFGMSSLGLTEADLMEENTGVYFGHPPQRIDLINFAQGITFEQAWETRVVGKFGGVEINWLSRELLLRHKLAAARPQDLADVAKLERRPPRGA